MKKEQMLQASKEDIVNEIIRLQKINKKLKKKIPTKPDPKKIIYQTNIYGLNYFVYNDKLYVEYEDVLKRKYWWYLSPDEDNYYEEEGVDFFNFLYLNYKSRNIPEKVFSIFQDELTLLAKSNIESLNYIKDKNNCCSHINVLNINQLTLIYEVLEKLNLISKYDFLISLVKEEIQKQQATTEPR